MQQPKDIQLTPQIKSILENITKKNGGLLPTSAVVKAAEDEKSPLHKYFTWSDEDAAQLWREQEARIVIKSFIVKNEDLEIPVRAFTSLEADRRDGLGYRWTTEVMAKPNLREQLIEGALHELRRTQKRYDSLEELQRVWDAVDQTADNLVDKIASKPVK